jgi:AraC family transcriptional regulator
MANTSDHPASISIQRVLATLPDRPIVTSREREWRGITVDVHDYVADYSVRAPARDHHLICYCSSGSARLTQARDGVVHTSVISAGMSIVMPAGLDSTWEGDAAASARLRVPPSLIAAAAEHVGQRATSRFEIRNVFEVRDMTIARVALILMAELERPPHPAQLLISETLSCALAAHLLRNFNAFELPEARVRAPLGRAELTRITEFIEGNIDRSIGLSDLASLINVSRFHFARLFRRSTGITAIAYVEQCRVRRAQALIEETDLALAEVALLTGFADQSHFTRRFQRHVGYTPAVYAREHGRRRSQRAARADAMSRL